MHSLLLMADICAGNSIGSFVEQFIIVKVCLHLCVQHSAPKDPVREEMVISYFTGNKAESESVSVFQA